MRPIGLPRSMPLVVSERGEASYLRLWCKWCVEVTRHEVWGPTAKCTACGSCRASAKKEVR